MVNTLESQMSKYGVEFFSKSDDRFGLKQNMNKNTKGVSFEPTIFPNDSTELDTIVENDRDNGDIVLNKVTSNEIDTSFIVDDVIDNSFVEINDNDEYFDEGFGNIDGDDDDDDADDNNNEDRDNNENNNNGNNNNSNNNNNEAFTSPDKIIISEVVSTPDATPSADFNAKTPTLADLKLSEATRSLVGVNGRDNIQRKSFGGGKASLIPVRNRFDDSVNESNIIDNELNEDNNAGNISTYSLNDSNIEINITSSNIKGRKSLLHTPSNYKGTNVSSPLTPTTPTIGTPFQTCDLRLNNKDDLGEIGLMDHMDDIVDSPVLENHTSPSLHLSANIPITHLSLYELNTSIKEMASNPNSPIHTINEKINKINIDDDGNYSDENNNNNLKNLNDSDTSIDFSNNYLASPPKMAKILEPSKRRQTAVTHSNDLMIQLVTNDELVSAPVFIKKQVNLELLNKALLGINSYLATIGSNSSEQCLTQEQMDSLIIDSVGDGLSTKAILLCLLTLKRFDLAANSNVKVYKVKLL
jgi:hypothetical protein